MTPGDHDTAPASRTAPVRLSAGLHLDARQRAMLAEMKIPVWWPQVAGQPPQAPQSEDEGAQDPARSQPAPEAVPVQRPAAAPVPASVRPDAAPAPAPAPAPSAAVAMPDLPAADAGAVAQMDWAQLREAVNSCNACGLCEGRKAPVFAADPLPEQADWLVVGEPPDADEERAGTPFVGATGQLLDNMLRALQVSRDGRGAAGARLTPVVKCRPAAVRNPTPDELARCAVYLQREIALVRPRVILAMGRFAALSLLGRDYPELLRTPLGQVRGTVHHSMGIPVVVTYHPSKLLRAPLQKAQAWADLCLARAQATTPASASPS